MAEDNNQSAEAEGSLTKNRRDSAREILYVLIGAVIVVAAILVGSAYRLQHLEGQLSGIVLTALAGAITALLSFIGLIVKGLVDNLTDSSE